MNVYQIIYLQEAVNDLDRLFQIIISEFKAPITAHRYLQGILDSINSLKLFPQRHAVQKSTLLLKYGIGVRRLNYKRMAIIYTVDSQTVYIHRIIAASLIGE